MATVNPKLLIPFPDRTRAHWWNALFVHLSNKKLLISGDEEEEKKFYRAYLQYFKFQRLLPGEFNDLPLRAASNHKYIILQNSDNQHPFEEGTFQYGLSDGFILLISLEHELASIKKILNVNGKNESPNEFDLKLIKLGSYHFRKNHSIEWLARLIEYTYQTRYNSNSRQLQIPLKIIVGNTENESSVNHFLTKMYLGLLQRYARVFFPHAKLFRIKSVIRENPTRTQIEELANEMENFIGKII